MLSSTIECECVAQSCPSMRDSQINRGVFANVKSASRKAFPTSNRRRDEPEISLPHSAVLNVYVKAGCTSPLFLNESGKRSRLSSRIPSKGNTAEKKTIRIPCKHSRIETGTTSQASNFTWKVINTGAVMYTLPVSYSFSVGFPSI